VTGVETAAGAFVHWKETQIHSYQLRVIMD